MDGYKAQYSHHRIDSFTKYEHKSATASFNVAAATQIDWIRALIQLLVTLSWRCFPNIQFRNKEHIWVLFETKIKDVYCDNRKHVCMQARSVVF